MSTEAVDPYFGTDGFKMYHMTILYQVDKEQENKSCNRRIYLEKNA